MVDAFYILQGDSGDYSFMAQFRGLLSALPSLIYFVGQLCHLEVLFAY